MLMWGYFNACRKRIVSYAVLYFSESLAVTIWSRDAPNHTSQLFTANTYLTFKKGDSADICQSRSTYLLSYVYLSYCVCFMDVFILFLLFTFVTAGGTRIKLQDFTLPLLPSTSLLWVEMSHSLCSQQESCFLLCLKGLVPPTSIPSPRICDQIVTTLLSTLILCVTVESCCRVWLCLWVCFFCVLGSCVFMGDYLHLLHVLHTPVLHTSTPVCSCASVLYKSIHYMWFCVCVCVCLTVPILYIANIWTWSD